MGHQDRCGRPLKTPGKQCRSSPLPGLGGCLLHLSDDDWQALYDNPRISFVQTYGCVIPSPQSHAEDVRREARPPACHSWEYPRIGPPPGADPLHALVDWHNGRCASCGHGCYSHHSDSDPDLYLDHSHESGLVRGLLCGVCNRAEGLAPPRHPRWLRYRTLPPAVIIGITVTYRAPAQRAAKELLRRAQESALAAPRGTMTPSDSPNRRVPAPSSWQAGPRPAARE
ncbi:endonuclease domain-containing protein [Streptomyces sp. NPDC001889]